ncbi:unnamed protein product [Chrysoparadoxa australica]
MEEEKGDEGARPNKKQRVKLKLMGDSHMTKAERREARLKQKEIKEDLVNNRDELSTIGNALFDELHAKNEKVFDNKVRYTREAVNDMDNICLLGGAVLAQGARLSSSANTIEAGHLLDALKRTSNSINSQLGGGSNTFRWCDLGKAVGCCFSRAVPRLCFAYGAIEKPEKEKVVKQKKQPSTRRVEDAEVVKPTEVIQGGGGGSSKRKSPTAKRHQAMKAARDKLGNGQAPLTDFLVHPKSFTQTVENMMDLSFFIGTGQMGLAIDEETKMPMVSAQEPTGQSQAQKNKQLIVSMSMEDWQGLAECCPEEPMDGSIPRRKMGKGSQYHDPLAAGESLSQLKDTKRKRDGD